MVLIPPDYPTSDPTDSPTAQPTVLISDIATIYNAYSLYETSDHGC